MPNFWKVAVEGLAGGENTVNVLYYVDDDTGSADFDTAKMGELGALLNDEWVAHWATANGTATKGTIFSVTLVDEMNETISPFSVDVTATWQGVGNPEYDGLALCSIIGFRVGLMTEGQAAPTPKRSYIALGPLPSSVVGNNGENNITTAGKEALEGMVSAVLDGVLTDYRPCRVGRGRGDGEPSYGQVVDAITRPWVAVRRSRLRHPSSG